MKRNAIPALTLLLAATQLASADILSAANFDEPIAWSQYFLGIGYIGEPNFTNEAAAQRFVAGVGGPLTTVQTSVRRWQSEGVPLIVSVHAADGTLPGALLGQLVVPDTELTYDIPSTFDLSGLGINLVAGDSYVITFRVDQPILHSTRYSAILVNDGHDFGIRALSSRDGGVTWYNSSVVYEIGLRVSVLPEPTAAVALLLVAAVRRRRVSA